MHLNFIRIPLFLALLLVLKISFAQTAVDTVSWSKGKIMYKNQALTMPKFTELIKGNTEATAYLKKAKTQRGIGTFFGLIGGFCIGYPLGVAAGGGDAPWPVLGVGVGVLLVGIPLSSSGNKNLKKAIRTYNASLLQQ